jgi:hypothetical protein
MPSLVAVTTGISALGLAGWRRLGAWPALLFLVLAMSSPLLGGFAAQARPHPLSFGFVCLATAAWLLLLRRGRPSRRLLVAFGAAGMLASLSQHYGALAFGLEAMVLIAWLGWEARRGSARVAPAAGWADVRAAVLATALAIFPLVGWLAVTRQWTHASGTPPLTLPLAEEVVTWMLEPWSQAAFDRATENPHAIVAMMVLLVIAATLLAAGLLLQRRRDAARTGRIAIGAATLGIAVVGSALAVLQSLLGSPTFLNRSILSLMPVFDLGLAVALTLPFGRFAPVPALVLAVCLGGVAARSEQISLYGPLDQWREAAALIRDEQRSGLPSDRIAVMELFDHDDWIVSLGNAYGLPAPVDSLPPQLAGLRWIGKASDVAAIPAGPRILMVAFHYYSFETQAAVVGATQARFGPCRDKSVRGITILDCEGGAPGG